MALKNFFFLKGIMRKLFILKILNNNIAVNRLLCLDKNESVVEME